MVEAIRSSTSVQTLMPVEPQWVPPVKKLKRREPTVRDLDTINADATKITQFSNMIWDTVRGDISSPAIETPKYLEKVRSTIDHALNFLSRLLIEISSNSLTRWMKSWSAFNR